MPIKTGNMSTTLLVGSGGASSILNESIAALVISSNPYAKWVSENKPQPKTFFYESVHIEGNVRTPVTRKVWHSLAAAFIVVFDGFKPLIG